MNQTPPTPTHGPSSRSVEAAMATYFVECYRPGITREQGVEALAMIAQTQNTADTPNRVCPLECIVVPSDGMAFFLVDGPSEDVVRAVGEMIELPFDRIVESFPIALGRRSEV
jgi:hypothetical protein